MSCSLLTPVIISPFDKKSQQQIPTTNLDTFAEFLVADDSGGTSCSSTDLKEGYAEDPGAKLNEGQKTARANRPRAARPRPNRNIEVITDSISGDDKVLMEKKPDADSNEISDDFVQVKNKKRKSGTKSRMAMRKPDSESSPSPPKPSKIPVKLDKDGHRGPPKSRQGKRRSKESLQDYPVSPVKSKGRKRSSNENLLVWPTVSSLTKFICWNFQFIFSLFGFIFYMLLCWYLFTIHTNIF